jgi:hypothetical protein
MVLDLFPDCVATVLPWGTDGVFLTVRSGSPSGMRTWSVVGEGPFSASMWAWRRADSWEGVVPEGCPRPPSVLDPSGVDSRGVVFARDSRPVEALGALLRGPGLLESLWVMES